eukprot:2634639-Amphidinium_carterae.2
MSCKGMWSGALLLVSLGKVRVRRKGTQLRGQLLHIEFAVYFALADQCAVDFVIVLQFVQAVKVIDH